MKAWRLKESVIFEMTVRRPRVVAVSGFSSNVGKTTLVCELLRALPGWEAIKLTRGHYRSCGRDPAGCCVSDLIRDEPVVRSGVIVEGNSFLEYVKADLAIMCARSEGGKIKPSARKALAKSDFLYLSTLSATAVTAKKQFDQFRADLKLDLDFGGLQIITREDFPVLLSTIYRGANVAQPVTPFPPLAIAARD